MGIHPTAVVDSHAQLGRDVEIGPYAVIGPEVVLGDGVRVGPHVAIEGRTTIGPGTEILHGASLGMPPGHLKDRGQGCELVIGARVSIREQASLHRGTKLGMGRTVIGDECSIFAHAHVGHDCVVGKGVVLINGAMLGGHVQVGDYVTFGANSGAHQHCRVGTLAMIAGGSGLSADVPPYCMGVGWRTRLLGLNEVGLERRGVAEATIRALRTAYRVIFRSSANRTEALRAMREEFGSIPEVRHFIEFIESAGKRPIARHGRE